jgi:EamA domain-containing membrane protein RarD
MSRFSQTKLVAFRLIWAALVIYSWSSVLRNALGLTHRFLGKKSGLI